MTDYPTILEHVLDNTPSEELAGVLIVSDGRQNGRAGLDPVGRRFGLQEGPICGVVVGVCVSVGKELGEVVGVEVGVGVGVEGKSCEAGMTCLYCIFEAQVRMIPAFPQYSV